jgi:hypothetical protein
MKVGKLDDIRFVSLCARNQFKRELGRTLTKPEPKPGKTKPSKIQTEANPLWTTQLRSSNDRHKE